MLVGFINQVQQKLPTINLFDLQSRIVLILWNPARCEVMSAPKRVNPSPAGNSFKGVLKSGTHYG
jgi:hypothetical protein